MERYYQLSPHLEFLPPQIRHHRHSQTHPRLRPQNHHLILGPGTLVASVHPRYFRLVVYPVHASGVWMGSKHPWGEVRAH